MPISRRVVAFDKAASGIKRYGTFHGSGTSTKR